MDGNASREVLGSALECDNRKVSPLRLEMNRQIEPDSGLTADENLRRSAPRPSGPALARFEARYSASGPLSMVNLIRGSASQPGMRSVAVVPGEVERQFLLESGETVRNQDQPSRALGF